MSRYTVRQSSLKGEIFIPSSKSQTLRAILFGAMGNGKSVIHNYLPSTDSLSMINACRLLGARVSSYPGRLEIEGVNGAIHSAEDVIDAGNSGIVLRFCAAIGALAVSPVVLTGDHSIRHSRPMQPLLDGLNQLSASAASTRGNGYAPVIIKGPLQAGSAVINGEDSQPVSALLIAAALGNGPFEVHVKNPGEQPWVGLTLDWFDRLGIPYVNHDFAYYHLPGNCRYDGFTYAVPGDFSSAAFPIAAALVTQSEVTIQNVDMSDPQGDKELISALIKMGAFIDIDEQNHTLHVRKGPRLLGVTLDINNYIDAITILAVIGCYAEGETRITNASIARHKECDRIGCVAAELRKMGGNITETHDGLIVRPAPLRGAEVHSHQDHRMAMSLAVAGMGAEGETSITSIDCVSKTFPDFAAKFLALGAQIQEIP